MMDIYVTEALDKIIDVLHKNNFKTNAIDCSMQMNGTDRATVSKPASIIKFEETLNEYVVTTPMLQMYRNLTNSIEYYLKVSVFGRDGNEMPIVSDESAILTELATIDNSQFSLISNVSLTAPRRFFRIGIGHVIIFISKMNQNFFLHIFMEILFFFFAMPGTTMDIYEIGSEDVNATPR